MARDIPPACGADGVCLPEAGARDADAAFFEPAGLTPAGRLVPRHAREIEASNWSIGAETMDRGFTVYEHWREHLGPLGAKRARIQSGWARTEPQPGRFDWSWLDAAIPDIRRQGVEPWVCLCYGNPGYAGGGDASSASPLPTSPEALAAWDAFVRAFVRRYGGHVDEWEIWNEPQHQGISIDDYAAFVIRTAGILREEQPHAEIYAGSTAGIRIDYTTGLLKALQAQGKLELVDRVTYHPYTFNPQGGVARGLRTAVRAFSGRLDIFQGECGIPSEPQSAGALAHPDNTERRQAKWALRLLLGDLGQDIRSSYFGIVDMHYVIEGKPRMNPKGLIATNPDKTVHHLKPAYRAVQHVTAVFDDSLARVGDLAVTLADARREPGALEVYAYEPRRGGQGSGGHVLALWRAVTPTSDPVAGAVDVTVTGGRFPDPVYVEMLSGRVYAFGADRVSHAGNAVTFHAVPVGDWPVLIADRAALPCRIAPAR